MAITYTHAQLFRTLPLPCGGSLLEIGEANWYGDVEPDFPCEGEDGFGICKAFYRETFDPSRIVSIDFGGTPDALRHDLNAPLHLHPMGKPLFDVVINHGTAEHIFNIAQVFATMHDRCEYGGLMVHDCPFTGWIDHGFYCLHPTLFYDLAAANNYEVVLVAVHALDGTIIRIEGRDSVPKLAKTFPENSQLFVAFRKIVDMPFRIPMQGYYANSLSEAGRRAWEVMR